MTRDVPCIGPLPKLPLSETIYETSDSAIDKGTSSQPRNVSVLVILMGRVAVGLTPLEQKNPDSDTLNQGSYATHRTQDTLSQLIQDAKWAAKLKQAAVQAFNTFRSTEYTAYACVDLLADSATGHIHISNIDPFPPIFHPREKPEGTPHDLVIEHTFPGGHAALFEVLLSTKLSTLPQFRGRNLACAKRHDQIAPTYPQILAATNVTANRLSPFFTGGRFDYSGTVLECCPGDGALARFALDNTNKNDRGTNTTMTFTGVELSPNMASSPSCQTLYHQPMLIGPAQELLMLAGPHDHVVCFGSFHLFAPCDFISTLCQMFLLARRSVAFDVDALSPTYIAGSMGVCEREHGRSAWREFNWNNVAGAVRLGVPRGWRAVVDGERRFAYRSPLMGEDVWTCAWRFERG
ncbi:MAG: hypothetical protein Q9160_001297 [Pyrenula sp. 1 TL-2023]